MDVCRLLQVALTRGEREVVFEAGYPPRLAGGMPLSAEVLSQDDLERLAARLPAHRQAQLAARGDALDALDLGDSCHNAGALLQRRGDGHLRARVWTVCEQDDAGDA